MRPNLSIIQQIYGFLICPNEACTSPAQRLFVFVRGVKLRSNFCIIMRTAFLVTLAAATFAPVELALTLCFMKSCRQHHFRYQEQRMLEKSSGYLSASLLFAALPHDGRRSRKYVGAVIACAEIDASKNGCYAGGRQCYRGSLSAQCVWLLWSLSRFQI